MDTSTIYLNHALQPRGFARRLQRALDSVPGLPPLEKHVSRHLIALELRDDAYRWPLVLTAGGSRCALAGVTARLVTVLGANLAIVAPRGCVAWDCFAHDATLQELLAKLEEQAGTGLLLLRDGRMAVMPDARLSSSYCVLRASAEM